MPGLSLHQAVTAAAVAWADVPTRLALWPLEAQALDKQRRPPLWHAVVRAPRDVGEAVLHLAPGGDSLLGTFEGVVHKAEEETLEVRRLDWSGGGTKTYKYSELTAQRALSDPTAQGACYNYDVIKLY